MYIYISITEFPGAPGVTLTIVKTETVTCVQNLDETVYVSLHANTSEKGMNPFLPPAIGKW